MSTLGLSGPPQRTEGLWKGLFWPSIQNAQDADLAATRGFWLCFALALVIGVNTNFRLDIRSLSEWALFLFYLLGAAGVRQASVSAAGAMLAAYFLNTVLVFWISPFHFSFLRLIGLALLLTNLRASFLIRRWQTNPQRQEDLAYAPGRQSETWRDKLVDQMPMRVWPWGRAIFYALALALIPLEAFGIVQLLRRSS